MPPPRGDPYPKATLLSPYLLYPQRSREILMFPDRKNPKALMLNAVVGVSGGCNAGGSAVLGASSPSLIADKGATGIHGPDGNAR